MNVVRGAVGSAPSTVSHMNQPLQPFLHDLVIILMHLHEELVTAKQAFSAEDQAFKTGHLYGLCVAIALVHSQLIAFGLDPQTFGFTPGFDPELDLLRPHVA